MFVKEKVFHFYLFYAATSDTLPKSLVKNDDGLQHKNPRPYVLQGHLIVACNIKFQVTVFFSYDLIVAYA